MANAETLTFEKVWEMFRETDRKFQETREQMTDTDRRMKETDRIIGRLGNRFGEMVEHMVVPNIIGKFRELGYTLETVSQDIKIHDSSGQCIAEIDILLENGDTAIAVEVKSKPVQKDIKDHVKRMEILRRRADARQDRRKFFGAIAGAVISRDIRNYAHKTGLYVIEQSCDTVTISLPESEPKEW